MTGKYGRRYVPGKVGTLIGAAVAAVFGIFWTATASSMGAPGFFPLFGVVFILVAVAGGIYGFAKAGEYEQAEREYQSRRAALLRSGQGG
jgi:high-affinity Fe2+/Pb2+ permease